MNKTYVIVIVLVILLVGGALVWGMRNNAGVPMGEVPDDSRVACTMEAKLCPDGSYVGRTGPNCEFTACPSPVVSQAVKEFVVEAKDFSFTPSLISVESGDKVKIIFKNTGGFHDFKIDAYGVAAKQAQSPATEVLEFTADKTGSFEYYCSVGTHRAMGMKGTLVVK